MEQRGKEIPSLGYLWNKRSSRALVHPMGLGAIYMRTTDEDKPHWESGFKNMSSSYAENGNDTVLSKESSRKGAANTINHNRGAYAYGIHRRDMALCELAHWTVGRMFRDSSSDDPPTEYNHNCSNLDYHRLAGTTESITYSPGMGEEEITETYTDLGGGRPRVDAVHGKPSASVTANQIKAGDPFFCRTRPCEENDVYDYNQKFSGKITQIDNEERALREAIKYEKDQRGNLETLRDEKGIEDWHLEIIYTDREKIRSETNPSSEGGLNYLKKQAAVPYIWLGVATSIALGSLFVGKEIRDYRIAKKGQM